MMRNVAFATRASTPERDFSRRREERKSGHFQAYFRRFPMAIFDFATIISASRTSVIPARI